MTSGKYSNHYFRNVLIISRSFISSDHSDEESELWARTVDLPGFDDNVSPQNIITMLLRLIVGEVRNIIFLKYKC
jgi:hypothetical protein